MAEEKNFENRIKKFLKDNGAYYVKYWGGGTFTKAGVPDILVCLNGRFLAVEVKATHGTPSALQIAHLKQIDETGGYACLLYPKDWDLFKQFINASNMADKFKYYEELKKRWNNNELI